MNRIHQITQNAFQLLAPVIHAIGLQNAMVIKMPYVNQTFVMDAMLSGIRTAKKSNARKKVFYF